MDVEEYKAQAEHDPAPELELVDNPNGDGKVGLYKVGIDKWEVVELAGPRENRNCHIFADLDDFAAWLKRSTPNPDLAQVLADVRFDGEKIAAYIQAVTHARDPGADHVICELLSTPEIAVWMAAQGKPLTQKSFFDLIRSYKDCFASQDHADRFMAALSTLRVAGSSTLECQLARNGRIAVSGARGEVSVSEELDPEIMLHLPIYEGVMVPSGGGNVEFPAKYHLRAVLDVQADPRSGLCIRIELPELPRIVRDAGRDLIRHLSRRLGKEWLVCSGQEHHEAVPMEGDPRAFGVKYQGAECVTVGRTQCGETQGAE